MIREAGVPASLQVFIHAESAQGEGGDIPRFPDVPDKFETTAVRQADIAQENIEFFFVSDAEGLRHVFRGQHLVAEASEEKLHRSERIAMVVDDEDASARPGILLGRTRGGNCLLFVLGSEGKKGGPMNWKSSRIEDFVSYFHRWRWFTGTMVIRRPEEGLVKRERKPDEYLEPARPRAGGETTGHALSPRPEGRPSPSLRAGLLLTT